MFDISNTEFDCGSIIKNARIKAGITQKQLAESTGLAEITIRQYESNKREPKLENLKKIAYALNIDLLVLIGAVSNIKPKNSLVSLFAGQPTNIAQRGLDVLEPLKESLVESAELTVSQGRELLDSINKLNEEGRQKVKDYADDLAENPKYRKSDTPEE